MKTAVHSIVIVTWQSIAVFVYMYGWCGVVVMVFSFVSYSVRYTWTRSVCIAIECMRVLCVTDRCIDFLVFRC
jgi:hypothetical protein